MRNVLVLLALAAVGACQLASGLDDYRIGDVTASGGGSTTTSEGGASAGGSGGTTSTGGGGAHQGGGETGGAGGAGGTGGTKPGEPLAAYAYGSSGDDAAYAVAYLDGGDYVVAGELGGSLKLGDSVLDPQGATSSAFVARFATNGKVKWARLFRSTAMVKSNTSGRVYDLAYDGQYIYTAGAFATSVAPDDNKQLGSNGGNDILVTRLHAGTGAVDWAASFGGSRNENGTGIAVKGAYVLVTGTSASKDMEVGGLPVTGTEVGDLSTDGVILLLGAADGKPKRAWGYGNPGKIEGASGPVFLDDGSALLAVTYNGSSMVGSDMTLPSGSNYDIAVLKLSMSPTVKLSLDRLFNTAAAEVALDMAALEGGDVVIAGYYNGTVTLGNQTYMTKGGLQNTADALVMRLRPDGKVKWGRVYGGEDTFSLLAFDALARVTVANNQVFAVGQCWSLFDLDGQSLACTDTDAVVLALDAGTGATNWSRVMSSQGAAVAWGVAWDGGAKQLLAAGSFDMTLVVGPATTLSSQGKADVFLTRFAP